jgi:hypothetical protein
MNLVPRLIPRLEENWNGIIKKQNSGLGGLNSMKLKLAVELGRGRYLNIPMYNNKRLNSRYYDF